MAARTQSGMMISYAQTFEDVMLERAFRDIEHGFYIDVGAWHPSLDSVTHHFYLRGWSGVNVEPNPHYMKLLEAERTRDTNIGCAVGSRPGRATITIIHGTGMSTLRDDIAQVHAAREERQERIEVELRTLDSIFEAAPPVVHFLKIDCEGAEADVLASVDLRRFRPWIILIEATEPLSSIGTHEGWEQRVLDSGYHFIYFDGVNRFYAAQEHADLARHFKVPPNVLDDFIVARMMIPVPQKAQKTGLLHRLRALLGLGSG
jgi:FkbM family methyltransferase